MQSKGSRFLAVGLSWLLLLASSSASSAVAPECFRAGPQWLRPCSMVAETFLQKRSAAVIEKGKGRMLKTISPAAFVPGPPGQVGRNLGKGMDEMKMRFQDTFEGVRGGVKEVRSPEQSTLHTHKLSKATKSPFSVPFGCTGAARNPACFSVIPAQIKGPGKDDSAGNSELEPTLLKLSPCLSLFRPTNWVLPPSFPFES